MMNSANVGHVLDLLKGSDIFHLRACGVCKVSTFNVVNVDDASSREGSEEVFRFMMYIKILKIAITCSLELSNCH